MMEFSREQFVERLKTVRKEQHHLTQEQISAKLGIKRNTYARYETDAFPPLPMLYKICNVLNVSSDYLLGLLPAEEQK